MHPTSKTKNRAALLAAAVLVSSGTLVSTALMPTPASAVEITTAIDNVTTPSLLQEVDFQGENYQVNIDDSIYLDRGFSAFDTDNTVFPTTNIEVNLLTPVQAKAGDTRTVGIPYGAYSGISNNFPDSSSVIRDAEGNIAATVEIDSSQVNSSIEDYVFFKITYTDWVESNPNSNLLMKIPYNLAYINNNDSVNSNVSVKVDDFEHVQENYYVYDPNATFASQDFGVMLGVDSSSIYGSNRVFSPILSQSDVGRSATFTHEVTSENNIFKFEPNGVYSLREKVYDDQNVGDYKLRHYTNVTPQPLDVYFGSTGSQVLQYSFTVPSVPLDATMGGEAGGFVMMGNTGGSGNVQVDRIGNDVFQWEDNVYTVHNTFVIGDRTVESTQRLVGNAITVQAHSYPVTIAVDDTTSTDYAITTPITIDLLSNDEMNSEVPSR